MPAGALTLAHNPFLRDLQPLGLTAASPNSLSFPEPHESPSLKGRRYWPIASLWGLARPCEVFMHPVPKPDRRSPSRPLDPSTCPECHALATPALSAPTPPCTTIAPVAPISGLFRSRSKRSATFRFFTASTGDRFPTSKGRSSATGRAHDSQPLDRIVPSSRDAVTRTVMMRSEHTGAFASSI